MVAQLTWARGSSQTLDQQLESLHGTHLGPLYVGDSCVVWSACGAPTSGIKTCPWLLSCLSGTYSPCWAALSSLDAGGRAWSGLTLMCLALLMLLGGNQA